MLQSLYSIQINLELGNDKINSITKYNFTIFVRVIVEQSKYHHYVK